MKIYAFSDIHENITSMKKVEAAVKKEDPDLVICVGDFTVFEQYLEKMIDWMDSLPKPVLLIHGNHEDEEIVEKYCSFKHNLTFMHKQIKEINGITFVGHGGGGFSKKYPDFEKFVEENKKELEGKKLVLLTHAPPYETKLDLMHMGHVGSKSYKEFIDNYKPVLALSGHIHETFTKEEKIGETLASNPGPIGKIFEI